MKVPCAVVGAVLPGGSRSRAKLRGVESFGMLCSARELGIRGPRRPLRTAEDAPVGHRHPRHLGLDDTLFTIKLTPNRADCLSLTGVAREVAALTGGEFRADDSPPVSPVDRCAPRHRARCAASLSRATAAASCAAWTRAATPDWMVRRLVRSGIRSISALVDITNYVMLELGQPLHAFDNTPSCRAPSTCVPAAAGEQVLLLNEQTVTPAADTLRSPTKPGALALAGIMGGEDSGITLDTTDSLPRGAFFAPDAIAGRALQRFQLGCLAPLRAWCGPSLRAAPSSAPPVWSSTCGRRGRSGGQAVATDALPAPVRPRPARARVLGIALADAEMLALLRRVHQGGRHETDILVTPPSFRFDIEIEEDLIEEIARLATTTFRRSPRRGLMMLPAPERPPGVGAASPAHRARYQEVVNFAFVEEAGSATSARTRTRSAWPTRSPATWRDALQPDSGLVGTLAANRKRQIDRVRVSRWHACSSARPMAIRCAASIR